MGFDATLRQKEGAESDAYRSIDTLQVGISSLEERLTLAKAELANVTASSDTSQVEVTLCQTIVKAKERRSQSYKQLPSLLGKVAEDKEAFKHLMSEQDLGNIGLYMKTMTAANMQLQQSDSIPSECTPLLEQRATARTESANSGVHEKIKLTGERIADLTAQRDLKSDRLNTLEADLSARQNAFDAKLKILKNVMGM